MNGWIKGSKLILENLEIFLYPLMLNFTTDLAFPCSLYYHQNTQFNIWRSHPQRAVHGPITYFPKGVLIVPRIGCRTV